MRGEVSKSGPGYYSNVTNYQRSTAPRHHWDSLQGQSTRRQNSLHPTPFFQYTRNDKNSFRHQESILASLSQSFSQSNVRNDKGTLTSSVLVAFQGQWPSGLGAGFPIQGSRVQNQWMAPRSTQPFILPRSIKWVPRISGNLVVKSKLPTWISSSLEAVEPHP